jgi:hypothetical protein
MPEDNAKTARAQSPLLSIRPVSCQNPIRSLITPKTGSTLWAIRRVVRIAVSA